MNKPVQEVTNRSNPPHKPMTVEAAQKVTWLRSRPFQPCRGETTLAEKLTKLCQEQEKARQQST
jgi:hypothetical protein